MNSDPVEKEEKQRKSSEQLDCREKSAEVESCTQLEKNPLDEEPVSSTSEEQAGGGEADDTGDSGDAKEEERLLTVPPDAKVSRTASALSTSRPSTIASVRAAVLAAQRMLVLGLLAVVGSALLSSLIIGRLMVPAIRARLGLLGDGALASIAGGFLSQIGLILFLPALAWGLAWVLDERPYRLCLGAALFTELWHVAVLFVTAGSSAIFADPVLLSTRVALAVLAGLLGGLAYKHGRRFAGSPAS